MVPERSTRRINSVSAPEGISCLGINIIGVSYRGLEMLVKDSSGGTQPTRTGNSFRWPPARMSDWPVIYALLQCVVEEVHRHLLQLARGGARDSVSLLRV